MYFKRLVVNRNRQINKMTSQLVSVWNDTAHDDRPNVNDDDCSTSDVKSSTTFNTSVILSNYWPDLVTAALHVVQEKSESHTHSKLATCFYICTQTAQIYGKLKILSFYRRLLIGSTNTVPKRCMTDSTFKDAVQYMK